MNNPVLYNENHSVQKKDAKDVLEKYASKLKCRKLGQRVLDVGCGDGSTTVTLLGKYLQHNLKALVGCDKNQNMVEYANKYFGNCGTNFIVLDITKELTCEMRNKFDLLFSVHTLHWIKKEEQEKAFTTLFNLLDDGGECLLAFLGYMSVYAVFEAMAGEQKWEEYMKESEIFLSPYHHSQDPVRELSEILEKIGFKDIKVEAVKKSFVFSETDHFKRAIEAVIPFPIPKEDMANFLEETLEEINEYNRRIHSESVKDVLYYTLLIVHATK